MPSWKGVRDSLRDWARTKTHDWIAGAGHDPVNAPDHKDGPGFSDADPDPDADEVMAAKVRERRKALPIPVFWLLGKAQSGKTSIIRALTRNSRAEIGDGFRPCTKTASLYDFPDPLTSFVRFLDTRGLGEVAYDPAEDLAQFQNQAHVLIVVMKALDHAQTAVLDAVKSIRKVRSDWPLLVVQTTLHEGYPIGRDHVLPYPFDGPDWQNATPQDLARSMQMQRSWFDGMSARFIAVDFTLADDGYQPEDYGLDALWRGIEETLPLGLEMIMRNEPATSASTSTALALVAHEGAAADERFARAHPRIWSHALAAGAAAAVPLPYVDMPVVLAIQGRMLRDLCKIYEQPFTPSRVAEIVSALGVGMLGRMGARELLKVVPGFGSVVSGAYAASYTYALGRTICVYFEHLRSSADNMPGPEVFRKVYRDEFENARERIKKYFSEAGEWARDQARGSGSGSEKTE